MHTAIFREKDTNQIHVAVYAPRWCLGPGNELAWLQLSGAETAVRMVWAHLYKGRLGENLQPTQIYLEAGGDVRQVYVRPGKGNLCTSQTRKTTDDTGTRTALHMLILSSRFDLFHGDWVLDGDAETPSPWFVPALRRNALLTFIDPWATVMWRLGQHARLIERLPASDGVVAWDIQPTAQGWKKVVQMIATRQFPRGQEHLAALLPVKEIV